MLDSSWFMNLFSQSCDMFNKVEAAHRVEIKKMDSCSLAEIFKERLVCAQKF